ncbi:hypothetical protein GU926_09185 [Nibribacter ruber]|uniref:Uncharacterized protein n=1 Tax=Nibribacter ruber TaxID=2698458 RepID=A0A6P1P1G4_9BACT|nr:hypothetical protein [Nibribacter ruber]QHL87603.1 hypothetical protein GU926_09185 [Nibribacter ruber]
MKLFLSIMAAVCICFWACSSQDPAPTDKATEDPITTFFPNEVRPAVSSPCFAGAYYRKVMSSKDVWLGITGKVVLPSITFDPERKNPAKPQQYLDNPSVYMGGNMGGQETDIGLTWEVIRDANGNVTQDRRAFRPFLRRTSHPSGQVALYENAPAEAGYYWYPGEEVTMSVQIIGAGKLKLTIEGAGKKYEKEFAAAGYNQGSLGDFKRVNAIDQVANEGKPAQATKTKVENAIWKSTSLYRLWESKIVEVPMHSKRFTDMRCPNVSYFKIIASEDERKVGGEAININGAGY